ncbi:MAG: acetylglutamate kinase, partial [Verrucomicrobiales bacterium]
PTSMQEQIDKAAVLVEALPYMQGFRGKTFLIKVGGSAMENQDLVRKLMRDIVFMEVAGINPVLVHGGGKAISKAMRESGLEAKFINGQRVTDEKSIGIVEKTLSREVNPRLVKMINDFGGKAIGLSGRDVFSAERVTELGCVGKVARCETQIIRACVASENVPVVSPVGSETGTGLPLNINADLAASALASALKPDKLIYLSDVLGIMRDPAQPESLINSITSAETEQLIAEGVITGGMIPKVHSATEALEAGVEKVHLIDGRIPHSLLLEVFTKGGIGTQIINN